MKGIQVPGSCIEGFYNRIDHNGQEEEKHSAYKVNIGGKWYLVQWTAGYHYDEDCDPVSNRDKFAISECAGPEQELPEKVQWFVGAFVKRGVKKTSIDTTFDQGIESFPEIVEVEGLPADFSEIE